MVVEQRLPPVILRSPGDRFYAVLSELYWDPKNVIEVGSRDWTEEHYKILDEVVFMTITRFGTSHVYFTLKKPGEPSQKMLYLNTNVPEGENTVWNEFKQSCAEHRLNVPVNIAHTNSY